MDGLLSPNARYEDDGVFESTPGSPYDQDSSARSSANGNGLDWFEFSLS